MLFDTLHVVPVEQAKDSMVEATLYITRSHHAKHSHRFIMWMAYAEVIIIRDGFIVICLLLFSHGLLHSHFAHELVLKL